MSDITQQAADLLDRMSNLQDSKEVTNLIPDLKVLYKQLPSGALKDKISEVITKARNEAIAHNKQQPVYRLVRDALTYAFGFLNKEDIASTRLSCTLFNTALTDVVAKKLPAGERDFKKPKPSTYVNFENCMTNHLLLEDGSVITAFANGAIKRWNKQGQCIKTFNGHFQTVFRFLLLSPTRFASVGWDSEIRVWDLDSAECIATLRGHTAGVNSILNLNMTQFATASFDRTVKIWDKNTFTLVKTFHSDNYPLNLYSTKMGTVAAFCEINVIEIWDDSSDKPINTLKSKESKDGSSYAFLDLSDSVYLLTAKNSIEVWDKSSNACVQTRHVGECFFPFYLRRLSADFFASCSTKLGFSQSTIHIWDTNFQCVQAIECLNKDIFNFTVINNELLISYNDGTLQRVSFERKLPVSENDKHESNSERSMRSAVKKC